MRVHSCVTSISWIPSEAVEGPTRASFDLGVTHYDAPPPEVLADVESLRDADVFRFANALRVSADFDGDECVSHEVSGGVVMGSTTVRIARLGATFQAVALPDLRGPVVTGPGWVRVTQTCGGRTALPLPRPVRRPPFVQLSAPIVWTTLALTLRSDGRSSFELAGASPFPRHWIYDANGRLAQKAGVAHYKGWTRHAWGKRTPWGSADSPVVVTAAESALERELSARVMRGGAAPAVRSIAAGQVLTKQGDPGAEMFLVLDGVLAAEVDGELFSEFGPGAVLGERAALEGGTRKATLTALTPVRLAVFEADRIEEQDRHVLATSHGRSD